MYGYVHPFDSRKPYDPTNNSLKKNREIFDALLKEALESISRLSSREKAKSLSVRIGQIAKKALERGFDPTLYTYNVIQKSGYLAFSTHPLWEGQDKVPVTFRIYVWPSESEAKSRDRIAGDRENGFYRSNIHSHPIACALTVIEGSVLQRTFVREDNSLPSAARLLEEKTLHLDEGEFDEADQPFIHQILCNDSRKKADVTLHCYHAPTEKSVDQIFSSTFREHSYTYTIDKNGHYQKEAW